MYVPEAYVEARLDVLHDAMRACGLAMFVTAPGGMPAVSHVPMLLDADAGAFGTLHFHLARANPQAGQEGREAGAGGAAVAVFPGPDGYISPSWYASKAEHGRVVPTWNYVTVHAEGVPRFYRDEAGLRGLVTRLTALHEGRRAAPWTVEDAPAAYTEQMLRAIVGVEMPITRLQGAWKLGQNKGAADRAGLLAGFEAEGGPYAGLANATRLAFGT
jgi:transcriptional regulator